MLSYINPEKDPRLEEFIIRILRTGHLHRDKYGNSRDLTVRDENGNVL